MWVTFLPIISPSCWWLRHNYWGIWNFVQHLTTRLPSKLLLITPSVFKLQLNWHVLTILVLVWYRAEVFKLFNFLACNIRCTHQTSWCSEFWTVGFADGVSWPLLCSLIWIPICVYHTACLGNSNAKGLASVEPTSENMWNFCKAKVFSLVQKWNETFLK